MSQESLGVSGIVGNSKCMSRAVDLLHAYAGLAPSVVLIGPSGVGKGLFAQVLHRLSGRAGQLVTVSAGALSDSLCHSQLFGHSRGAFTGAHERLRGAFERAANGTLFLDEMPLWSWTAQSALLRPLSEGKFLPLGAEKELDVSCNLVFASTRALDELVDQGILLPDLRWRVPPFVIEIPPLHARRGDILPIATAILSRSGPSGRSTVHSLGAGTIKLLLGHNWPGNVRELQGVISVGAVHAGAAGRGSIEPEDLPAGFPKTPVSVGALDAEALELVIRWAVEQEEGSGLAAARLLGLHRNMISRHRIPRPSPPLVIPIGEEAAVAVQNG